jgi:predicted RNA-binding protein with EMAP domain
MTSFKNVISDYQAFADFLHLLKNYNIGQEAREDRIKLFNLIMNNYISSNYKYMEKEDLKRLEKMRSLQDDIKYILSRSEPIEENNILFTVLKTMITEIKDRFIESQ